MAHRRSETMIWSAFSTLHMLCFPSSLQPPKSEWRREMLLPCTVPRCQFTGLLICSDLLSLLQWHALVEYAYTFEVEGRGGELVKRYEVACLSGIRHAFVQWYQQLELVSYYLQVAHYQMLYLNAINYIKQQSTPGGRGPGNQQLTSPCTQVQLLSLETF